MFVHAFKLTQMSKVTLPQLYIYQERDIHVATCMFINVQIFITSVMIQFEYTRESALFSNRIPAK